MEILENNWYPRKTYFLNISIFSFNVYSIIHSIVQTLFTEIVFKLQNLEFRITNHQNLDCNNQINVWPYWSFYSYLHVKYKIYMNFCKNEQ